MTYAHLIARVRAQRFVVSGLGLVKAVAGVEAMLRIRVADRFDNTIHPSGSFPYAFGLLLLPSRGERAEDIMRGSDKKKSTAVDKGGKLEQGAGGKRKPGEDERTSQSMPYVGAWVGNSYEMAYVAEEAGAMDLHLWVTPAPTSIESMIGAQGGPDSTPAGGEPSHEGKMGAREFLPGSAFTVHVSEGNASAIGSFVRDAEAKQAGGGGQQHGGFVAGEHIIIRPQVRDVFSNASTAPEGSLTAEHEIPGAKEDVQLEPPKMRGGLGSYELSLEPVRSGTHIVHIKLHGEEITGSPVSFKVSPGAPSVPKCYLTRGEKQAVEKVPFSIVVTLVDKYGNRLDRGGVRVDAKALGAAATSAVEDQKDGTYLINISAGAPGEVKVTVRIDGVELTPMNVTVIRSIDIEANAPAGGTPPVLEGHESREWRGSLVTSDDVGAAVIELTPETEAVPAPTTDARIVEDITDELAGTRKDEALGPAAAAPSSSEAKKKVAK